MTKKKTILFIDIEGGYGGSSNSLFQMVTALNKKKFKPIIICKKDGPIIEKYFKRKIDCYVDSRISSLIPLKKNNFKNFIVTFPSFIKIKGLLKKIISLKPDILHLNYEGLVPLHFLLVEKSFKTVLHFRSSAIHPNFLYKLFALHINRKIDYLIFISENEKEVALRAGIDLKNKPHCVLHNTVEKIVDDPFIKKNNKLTVIFLANLDSHKGSTRLIEIAKHLKQLKSKIKINAFGSSRKQKKKFLYNIDTLEKLRQEVICNNLSDWLEYHGYSNQPSKEIINSDILISPSEYNDPWGRNIIEALSLGVPVITHGNYDKFVKNNETGVIFKEWNSLEYAKKLNEISNNKKLLLIWSKNAISLAKKLFDKKKYGKLIEDIYDSL